MPPLSRPVGAPFVGYGSCVDTRRIPLTPDANVLRAGGSAAQRLRLMRVRVVGQDASDSCDARRLTHRGRSRGEAATPCGGWLGVEARRIPVTPGGSSWEGRVAQRLRLMRVRVVGQDASDSCDARSDFPWGGRFPGAAAMPGAGSGRGLRRVDSCDALRDCFSDGRFRGAGATPGVGRYASDSVRPTTDSAWEGRGGEAARARRGHAGGGRCRWLARGRSLACRC
jgi:hypothetical protein